MFSKKFFTNIKTQLDFSTTLTKDIKVIDEIACITRFNSDPVRAFRGAFRETAKLHHKLQSDLPEIENKQARQRLAAWVDPIDRCDFYQFVLGGAYAGISEAKKSIDLSFINDPDLMIKIMTNIYPEIDMESSPIPTEDNPMKHELFFTTRIASSLYDPFVLEHLQLTELRDALSDGQLLSKNWLLDVLEDLIKSNKIKIEDNKPLRVAILGGWIGTLSLLMHARELPFAVTSIDLDDRSNKIAEKLNYDYNFKARTMDMYDIDYSDFDLIINTSSEHIPDIPRWRDQIPAGKLVLVQNNDFDDGDGHVSCVKNSNSLRKILKFSDVLYEGSRTFPQYSRFMLVGIT